MHVSVALTFTISTENHGGKGGCPIVVEKVRTGGSSLKALGHGHRVDSPYLTQWWLPGH